MEQKRLELGRGIQVNGIAPGEIITEGFSGMLKQSGMTEEQIRVNQE